jgi:competence protein ComEA
MRASRATTAGLGAAVALLLLAGPLWAQSAKSPAPSRPKTQLTGVVNVNTATPEQLELLPGVGPTRAVSIIEHRKANGPFEHADDLEKVSGIGPKALERMRPHVAISGKTTAALEQ